MRRLCGHIAVSLTFSGLLLWASASIGKAQPGQERADNPSTDVGPLDRLLPTIRRSHPGELSDAHGPINDASGAPHYHLKWITPGGDVFWFDVDAQSGQVLRASPGSDSFGDR
jgi:uncharacterized membrane protein YkoI